jgi:hypothetical protein
MLRSDQPFAYVCNQVDRSGDLAWVAGRPQDQIAALVATTALVKIAPFMYISILL